MAVIGRGSEIVGLTGRESEIGGRGRGKVEGIEKAGIEKEQGGKEGCIERPRGRGAGMWRLTGTCQAEGRGRGSIWAKMI